MKKLLLFFAAVGAVLSGSAQLNGIVVEPFTITGGVSVQPPGTTTYRVYAEFQQATDKMSAVFATLDCHQAYVHTTTSFHNDGFGNTLGSVQNIAFFNFFPTYQADSWLTIGADNNTVPGAADVGAVATVPASPYAGPFGTTAAGGNFDMEDGAWYTLATSATALPSGPNNRVLLGQFTTSGDLSFGLNLQVFVGGDQANGRVDYVWQETCYNGAAETGFEAACPSCVYPSLAVDGCTNPLACNYDPAATNDDGSCDLVSCLGCTNSLALNFDATATIDDGSCIVPTCAPTTPDNFTYCYAINELTTFTYVGAGAGDQVIIVINAGSFETGWDFFTVYDGTDNSGTVLFSGDGDVSGLVFVSTTGALTLEIDSDESFACSTGSETALDYDVYCGVLSNPGCTDPAACNYDAAATSDDGSCVLPAANDLCAGAIALTSGVQVTVDNTAACQGEAVPVSVPTTGCSTQTGWCPGQGSENAGVWYTFTTPANAASVVITTSDDGVAGLTDTQVAVFDGCGGNFVAGNDDFGTLYSQVSFACGVLAANTTYYVLVDKYSSTSTSGTCFLNITIDENACLTGCTDANAINFTPGAVIDDGSCVVPTCAPTTPTNVTYCYGNNENSQVIYTATAGNQVIISFNSGALESCCDDLNIYDGIGTGGTLIGTYTGDLSGLVVQSTTGAITIQVISDSSVSCSSGSLCCSAGFDYDVYCGSVAVLGCTDAGASNYDPAATVDDGSCVFCNDNLVDVVIVNGDFPGEMSWSIVDGASNVVASGNGNSADLTLCLPTGCYSVDMADSFGDGWNGGAIEFYVGGSLIASVDVDNAVIGDGESTGTDFVDIGNSGSCPVLGCTLVGACNYDPAATLDDGSCIAGPCVNDLPALAYAIPVNNLGVCAGVSGDMNEATVASPEATYRTSALDLWYTFVPSTSGVRVEFNTVDFDALIELQDASNNPIDIEDVVFVNGGEVLNIGNLTAGQTYYLRVAPWNPTSAPAPFDLCVQSIPDTRCDYGSGPYSLCNLFKADWVLADDYLFYFTSQTTGMTYTYQSGTGSSFLVLSNVSGLTWDDTYDVEISAIWDLNDGNGDAETIEVLNDEPCFIIVNPAPLAQMRPSDNQANYGPHYLGDYIAATPFVCGVIDWTWEFVNTDGSQLPIVQSRGIANAFIRLNTITGLVPGAVYEVRVRPEFNGYSGNYGPVQLLSIIGPVNQEANVAPVVLEDAAERVVAGDITETALYPNPNSGELVNLNINNIPSDVERITVDIYNGVGALVVSQQIAVSGVNMQSTMSLNELAGGIYTVNINVGNEVRTERLIIQK